MLAPSMWELPDSNELVAKWISVHHSGDKEYMGTVKEIPKPPGIENVIWEKPLTFSVEQNRWIKDENCIEENISGNLDCMI